MLRTKGKIVEISNRDKVIARFSRELDLETEVKDKRNRTIGKISWIFGPVDDPYYEINTSSYGRNRLALDGDALYAEEE